MMTAVAIILLGVVVLLATELHKTKKRNKALMLINNHLRDAMEQKSWGSKRVRQ